MEYTKFKLTNVVLYAKGWYKHTDDVYEDLKKILELDGYTPFSNQDVYEIICSRLSEMNWHSCKLKSVLDGIHPSNTWKYGYYTQSTDHRLCTDINRESLPVYDMQLAFIYYALFTLHRIPQELWNRAIPKYTKYPKKEGITIRKVYEIFVEPRMIKSLNN